MATGFMPYVLKHSAMIFGEQTTPSKKITPPGYLKMLLSNDRPQLLGGWIQNSAGHVTDAKIKYRTRVPAGKSGTSDDCSINAKPAYAEATINLTKFRKYSIVFDDQTIAQYESEASNTIMKGNPATPFMTDTYNAVIEAANGLFADINNDLLTSQASAFGFNSVTASNAARTADFKQNAATANDLDTGMTRVMSDAMLNEMNLADARIVGSGLINNYYLQNKAAISANQSGLNTSNLALPDFYFDPYAASKWGTNHFGVFEKNSVQLVNIARFTGFRGGDKMVTKLGTITLPVVDVLGDGILGSFQFDYQWEYTKCPTTATVGGYAGTALDRGWILHIMATYDQFNIPSDSYVNTDRMYAGNGTLRYLAANS